MVIAETERHFKSKAAFLASCNIAQSPPPPHRLLLRLPRGHRRPLPAQRARLWLDLADAALGQLLDRVGGGGPLALGARPGPLPALAAVCPLGALNLGYPDGPVLQLVPIQQRGTPRRGPRLVQHKCDAWNREGDGAVRWCVREYT